MEKTMVILLEVALRVGTGAMFFFQDCSERLAMRQAGQTDNSYCGWDARIQVDVGNCAGSNSTHFF